MVLTNKVVNSFDVKKRGLLAFLANIQLRWFNEHKGED